MALALVCVASVILIASEVLTNRYVSLREVVQARLDHERQLSRRVRRRSESKAGGTHLPALIYASGLFRQLPRDASYLFRGTEVGDLGALYDLQLETHQVLDDLLSQSNATDRSSRTWTSTDIPWLKERAIRLDRAAARIVSYSNDHTARSAFRHLRRRMLFAGAVAAVGVTLFAWLANPQERAAIEIRAPLPVDIVLTAIGVERLASDLGSTCAQREPIPAIAIAGELEDPTVVIIPTSKCQARKLRVRPQDGVVVPRLERGP